VTREPACWPDALNSLVNCLQFEQLYYNGASLILLNSFRTVTFGDTRLHDCGGDKRVVTTLAHTCLQNSTSPDGAEDTVIHIERFSADDTPNTWAVHLLPARTDG